MSEVSSNKRSANCQLPKLSANCRLPQFVSSARNGYKALHDLLDDAVNTGLEVSTTFNC